jgi:hypothetical protein
MRRAERTEQGLVMVLSLCAIFLLGILGSTFLSRSLHETQLERRSTGRQQAFFLAEAAVDHAVNNLRMNNTANLALTTLSPGTYWAELSELGSQRYQITAHGSVSSMGQRDLEAIVQRTPQSVFQYAVFGYQKVEVSNGAFTDSYNSTQGNYNPSAPGSSGTVGSNSTAPNQIKLDNGAVVNGQVVAGPGLTDPGAVVEVKNGAVITGNPPVVSAPIPLGAPVVVPPSGSCNQKLDVKNGDTATLVQALSPYCFSEVSVDNSATLNVSGSVTVYTGKLVVKNSALVNYSETSKPAPNLIVQITSDTQVLIDNGSKFVGAIYAPQATADVKNSSILYGSIVAKEVKEDNSAAVHYDQALAGAGPTGSYQVSVVSWRELN